jgi:DNA-binding LacI/PurR family transcriptional regulator
MASVALSSEVGSRCQAAGVPVVLFNRSQDMDEISSITSNNFEGGRKAARLLIDLAHEKIGYIAGWEGASTQRDREAGFEKEILDSGLTVFSRKVGNFRAEKTKIATFAMFDKPKADRPDAVFVANDHMAFIVMDILRYELGLSIPEDVSVIGYDDVPPASWKSYDLTTVRQRANLMVQETVNTILNRIENPHSSNPVKLQIDSPLVIRSSTRQKPI